MRSTLAYLCIKQNLNTFFTKNQGGVKPSAGSEMSLVSGDYHEDGETVVMEMASI